MQTTASKPRETKAEQFTPSFNVPTADVSIFSMPGMKIGPSPYAKFEEGDTRFAILFQAETRDAHTGRHTMIQHEAIFDHKDFAQMADPNVAYREAVRDKFIQIIAHGLADVLLFNGKRFKDPHPEKPEYAAGNDPSPSKVRRILQANGKTDRDYFPEHDYNARAERELFDCLGGRQLNSGRMTNEQRLEAGEHVKIDFTSAAAELIGARR